MSVREEDQPLLAPLDELAHECYSTATEKGFWEPVAEIHLSAAMSLLCEVGWVAAELEALRKDRPAQGPFDLSELLALDTHTQMAGLKLLLIISEAAEAFEALLHEPQKEGEEVADIQIRLLDYAAHRGISLDSIVAFKMDKNRGRPHKHGCNF